MHHEDTVLIAAASSLEPVLSEQVIPAFEREFPHIDVMQTYAASGQLRHQIEAGLRADVYLSADIQQVEALQTAGMIYEQTPLLNNELVLIVPVSNEPTISALSDIEHAQIVGIGDPSSVPAGRYAKATLEQQGLWNDLQSSLSLATNVTQVLTWVGEATVDAGLVYKSDAVFSRNVHIVCDATPENEEIVYPLARLTDTQASTLFYAFLQSDEAAVYFEEAGFTASVA